MFSSTMTRWALVAVCVVLGAAQPKAHAQTDVVDYVPGEVLVKFKTGVYPKQIDGQVVFGYSTLDTAAGDVGMRSCDNLFGVTYGTLGRVYKLKYNSDIDAATVAARLANNPNVEWAEVNARYHFALVPNDDDYSEQWALPQIDAPSAWDLTTGNANIVVAVLDSGVDWDHEDLDANIWENAGEGSTENGVDDDNNGYIDDIRGWDFTDFDQETIDEWEEDNEATFPEDGTTRDNDPDDDDGHGTHCAGIIAAEANNSKFGTNVVGATWSCTIMPVRVGTGTLGLLNDDIAAGIKYAADNGAHVISMSFGGFFQSSTISEALNYAADKNVILVAAAGNESTSYPSYPAADEGVIAVAATDENDLLTYFSNYGTWVDISAPGEDILSTYKDGGNTTMSGTSMACPYVSGVCGLMLSADPSLTKDNLETMLLESAEPIDDINPRYSGLIGSGRLDAYRAVTAAGGGDLTPIPLLDGLTMTGPSEVDEYTVATYTVNALLSDGSKVDVTSDASWYIRPNTRAKFVSAAGELTALQVPETTGGTIAAQYSYRGRTERASMAITLTDVESLQPLVIGGPSEVDDGSATVQYTATATVPGGTPTDVTDDAQWSVSPSNYAELLGDNGEVTFRDVPSNKVVTITVTYSGGPETLTQTLDVTVKDVSGDQSSAVSELVIEGPDSVQQQTMGTYRAYAVREDGTRDDITSDENTTWSVSGTNRATLLQNTDGNNTSVLLVASLTTPQSAIVSATYAPTDQDSHTATKTVSLVVASQQAASPSDTGDSSDANTDDSTDGDGTDSGTTDDSVFSLCGITGISLMGFLACGVSLLRRRVR